MENQIKTVVDEMYETNDIGKIEEKISELNTYITKKTKITGSLSPENSYIKTLIEKRNNLENSLTTSSEIIYAPTSGLVSYKVDGYEEKLGVDDFQYLTSEYLNNINVKTESLISTNTECGKIINNFYCYIACSMNSEKAMTAKVGDTVKLIILNGDEVSADIAYINEENNNRVIVFKIDKDVEKLVDYRKIDVDVVWWNYSGLKVSNSSLREENDISYVEQNKSGYVSKIYVKVSRQNETYSIIENYTDEELEELGIDDEYIENREKISLYDEILLH